MTLAGDLFGYSADCKNGSQSAHILMPADPFSAMCFGPNHAGARPRTSSSRSACVRDYALERCAGGRGGRFCARATGVGNALLWVLVSHLRLRAPEGLRAG